MTLTKKYVLSKLADKDLEPEVQLYAAVIGRAIIDWKQICINYDKTMHRDLLFFFFSEDPDLNSLYHICTEIIPEYNILHDIRRFITRSTDDKSLLVFKPEHYHPVKCSCGKDFIAYTELTHVQNGTCAECESERRARKTTRKRMEKFLLVYKKTRNIHTARDSVRLALSSIKRWGSPKKSNFLQLAELFLNRIELTKLKTDIKYLQLEKSADEIQESTESA